MEIPLPDYATWKNLCVTVKNLNNQFSESDANYSLIGPDSNGINWLVEVPKRLEDGSDNPDAADFEQTVKGACNFAIGQRAYPFSSSDMQFAGQGFVATFQKAAPGQKVVTDFFFKLADGYYLNGGEYWSTAAAVGDTLQVDAVDHDNLFGQGVDFVLVDPPFMSSWNIVPQDNARVLFQTNYAAKPPKGTYLRFRYTANGNDINVQFYCNLYLHKGI